MNRETGLVAAVLVAAAVLGGCRGRPDGGPPGLAPGSPLFTDISDDAGLRFVHFNGMSGELYMPEMMGGGGALVDFDNDGDLDVFLVQGGMLGPGKTVADARIAPSGPLGDRLFRNDLTLGPDGVRRPRFVDVTAASGISSRGYGMGVATGDADGDGWIDLYVTSFGHNALWRNRGDGSFEDVTAAAAVDDERWSVAAAFLDFDRDGRLDLYVGSYLDFRFAVHRQCVNKLGHPDYCSPAVYGRQPDRLFHNLGDGRFEEVSARAGITSSWSKAMGAVAADFDLDGWIDIYVANDGIENSLWMNQRDGTFRDEALFRGSAVNAAGLAEASMGVASADFDEDGDEDLVMTHLADETNTLYRNGDGFFEDATIATGLFEPSLGKTGFGVAWLDYDNDGWLDLVVANGAVEAVAEQLRAGEVFPLRQANQLFHNRGDGTLEEVTERAGPAFALSEVSRGAAIGDVDNDGDIDVLVVNNAGPARLLRNDVGSLKSWLGLRLVGAGGRDMLGALVDVIDSTGRSRRRRVQTAGSYASASDPRIVVGLGGAAGAATVTVTWPEGGVEVWDGVPAGRYTTLVAGTGRPGTAAPRTVAGPAPSATIAAARTQSAAVPEDPLPAMPQPDLSSLEAAARARIEAQRQAVERLAAESGTAPAEVARAFGELGRSYHAAYFHQAAAACYRHALEHDAQSFPWRYYLGLLYEDEGRLELAGMSYQRAAELDPKNLATRLRLGWVLLQLGRLVEARGHLEAALKLTEGSAAAHYRLGRVLAAAGERESAVRHFERALALDPRAGSIRHALMLTLRDLGRQDEAKRYLTGASGEPVRFRDPLQQALYDLDLGARGPDTLARRALAAGLNEEAAAYYRKAIADNPSDAVAHKSLAQALERLGRGEEAEIHAREAVRLWPVDLPSRLQLARLLANRERPDEAIDLLLGSLADDPGSLDAHHLVAELLERRGRASEALPHHQALLAANPGHVGSWLAGARILLQLGRVDEALAKLEEAHRTMPADIDIGNALARLLATMPDSGADAGRRAVALMRDALERRPGPELAITMALALARAGDTAEAVRWQRQIVAQAEAAGRGDLAARHRAILARFERGEAVSVPQIP